MSNSRIQPIEDSKKTIAALVQDRIREAILDGLLPAGTRIDQNQLAADLNVSLVPVREALKKLEAEGFVHILPRRGAFITETSLDDMVELYFARAVLEGQTAYHAAPHLTDEALADLDQLMGEMGDALERHDFPRFTQANRKFHLTIYNGAGNHYLINTIVSLWDLAERYRYRFIFLKDQASVIQGEHQAILDACHARDSRRVRDAIVNHINQTLAGIRSYIESNTPARG